MRVRKSMSPWGGLLASLSLLSVSLPSVAVAGDFCPALHEQGVLNLDFNPAFVHVDAFDDGAGGRADGLTISSFFNIERIPSMGLPFTFIERDLVARIEGLDTLDPADFEPSDDVEVLTDLDYAGVGPWRTVWPNAARRVPDGVLPFEAVVIPQGFHPAIAPGRLTIVDLEDPDHLEYVVHQSTQNYATGFTFPGAPGNSPRFYHEALFIDMDQDGYDDLVTARSGFRVVPSVYPPFSELVWFRNPGDALDPSVPWEETVLYGGPAAGFLGPDIHLDAHDFDGDGVPEIVATHFFSGQPSGPGLPPPTGGKIAIYGAPAGGSWADVDASLFMLPRVANLSTDQGFPFAVQIIDLDRDGQAEVLATNHQPDGCTPMTTGTVPGRVFALDLPAGADPFTTPWTTHVLLDDIHANPTPAPVSPPGRLAPGRATAFWPLRALEGATKPWIVVGGDEASRVWVLAPKSQAIHDWRYDSAVVFDINDFYGAGTTQTPQADPFGVTISTIGEVAWRYDDAGLGGWAELYIPVFEGRDLHVLSFHPGSAASRVSCPADQSLACGS